MSFFSLKNKLVAVPLKYGAFGGGVVILLFLIFSAYAEHLLNIINTMAEELRQYHERLENTVAELKIEAQGHELLEIGQLLQDESKSKDEAQEERVRGGHEASRGGREEAPKGTRGAGPGRRGPHRPYDDRPGHLLR